MDFPFLIFAAMFVLVGGRFIYGRLKYGSWTGSFLKGKIERTVGEVSLSQAFATSQKLQVHTMRNEDDSERFVALVVTSKAPMGASMQPYKLSNSQALELASYLTKAAQLGGA